jgi:hypothetical protein
LPSATGLVPGGVLAAWGYADFVAPEGMVDAVAAFRARIEPHWPPERAEVDARYAGYDWPFPALPAPDLWLEAEWSLAHFLRYLSSMSASARCLAESATTGRPPCPALAAAWGGGRHTRCSGRCSAPGARARSDVIVCRISAVVAGRPRLRPHRVPGLPQHCAAFANLETVCSPD